MPKTKIHHRPDFVFLRIFKSCKIQTGTAMTRRSVKIFQADEVVNVTLWSIHWPPGMALSQLNAIGRHWKTSKKKKRTIWVALIVIRTTRTRRAFGFWPNRCNRNVSTEALTSANIGLYRIFTV